MATSEAGVAHLDALEPDPKPNRDVDVGGGDDTDDDGVALGLSSNSVFLRQRWLSRSMGVPSGWYLFFITR